MITWKELIRLTYVESHDKGLLMEKLLYSMLRLFNQMISQQHITARLYQAEKEEDSSAIQKLLEQRSDQLSRKLKEANLKIKEL